MFSLDISLFDAEEILELKKHTNDCRGDASTTKKVDRHPAAKTTANCLRMSFILWELEDNVGSCNVSRKMSKLSDKGERRDCDVYFILWFAVKCDE